MKKFIICIAICLTACGSAFTQTNAPAAPAQTPPLNVASLKVADDVKQLMVDVFAWGGNVSWAGIALSAYLTLKGVRNRTSLGQNPKIAPLLNLLNIEAKNDFSQPQKPSTSAGLGKSEI